MRQPLRLGRRPFVWGALSAGWTAVRSATAAAERELLIVGAKLLDSSSDDAILIRGDRIVARGRSAALKTSIAADAVTLDARGGFVLAGFHDAHLHMHSGGESLRHLDLAPHRTLPAALDAIAKYHQAQPGHQWLQGRGWQYSLAPPGKFPSRRDLDRLAPDRPVFLRSFDGHTAWVNSRALTLAQIDERTPNPPNGEILREEDGKSPSGILTEEASSLIKRVIPQPTRAEKLANLATAVEHCSRLGLTSATDVYADLDEIDLYRELAAQDRLPLRISVSLPLNGDLKQYAEIRRTLTTPWIRLGFLKDFLDGVIESKTAYMLAPFTGTAERGKPMMGRNALDDRLVAANAHGFIVGLHSIGDAATRLGLDAFAAVRQADSSLAVRGRLEHLEAVDPHDLARFRTAGVVASMQPLHAKPESADPDTGAWSVHLGPERLPHSFPWRALLDAGAILAFGSDWPVVSADPLWGLAVALTRKNERQEPTKGWNAHQCISPREAVHAYTMGSALADGVAAERGALKVGMLADLVVLDPSVTWADPATLWQGQRIRQVVVGGRIRQSFPA